MYPDDAKERGKTSREAEEICLITRLMHGEAAESDGELQVGIRWIKHPKEERAQK